jgi:hypothetical protein
VDSNLWDKHLQSIAASADVEALRQGLLACAEELGPKLLGAGTGVEQWRDFGLNVVRRRMVSARGLLRYTELGPVVEVEARDHPRVQRYTVAHELGHFLLGDLDRRRVGLTNREEERLCEAFASNALIPRDDLDLLLEGFEDDPSDLLEMTARYDVSLSALLTAVGERLTDREVVAFAVSRRGHKKRPEEVALRAHRIESSPYLVPEEVRLGSLGLNCLDRRLDGLDIGLEIAGDDIGVELRLWRRGIGQSRSGSASGPVSWRARYLPNGFAVVCLSTPALTHRWSSTRALV